jgi:hypothetical protein
MVDGQGDPNTSAAYQSAVEILYGLSYAIKMSKNGEKQLPGYYDYVVPPLEGLWQVPGGELAARELNKDKFCWTSMLRVPEYVTAEVFGYVKEVLARKKPALEVSRARLEAFSEGRCAQIMHIGAYDNEPATLAVLKKYISASAYRLDLSGERRHHEIYLNDPRKTAPEKLKTILRYPIARRI